VRHFAVHCLAAAGSIDTETGVSILKPLCGPDAELLENLRSFCRQNHDNYQLIFGVRDSDDPAIAVVRQLINEFPQLDLKLVIDDSVHGSNLKISNLINMFPYVRHDLIVIADSDMRVQPDYLPLICSAMQQQGVGMVTCLYLGEPLDTLPSQLGAMFINEWFLPSVLVATRYTANRYCFGATMAIPRHILEETGGLESLADYLADDYMLGSKVLATGRRVEIAPVVVENILLEPTWKGLLQHELRWGRTMRTVQPLGYAGSFLTDALPVSLICAALVVLSGGLAQVAAALVIFALVGRSLLHLAVNKTFNKRQVLWLYPFRDLLTFLIRAASFMGGSVEWRKQSLHVNSGSRLSVKD
jgi:ceramide glucosyltransferase